MNPASMITPRTQSQDAVHGAKQQSVTVSNLLKHPVLFAGLVAALIVSWPLGLIHAGQDRDVFGQSGQSEAALMGVLYDLKQNEDRKPTNVDPNTYTKIIDEFMASGWDEAVLNRYYRVSQALYTTQIFVPNMNADEAPKAFGAEKTVQPSRWVIHYKGQVSAPESGTYRFWGAADDILAVAVNGKTVLVGSYPDLQFPNTHWKSTEGYGPKAADTPLRVGDWMDLKANQIIDLDIIIGERPGGQFNAFLLIEKRGQNYARDNGQPILPIFQVAPFQTPVVNDLNVEPKFAHGYPVWKSYQ